MSRVLLLHLFLFVACASQISIRADEGSSTDQSDETANGEIDEIVVTGTLVPSGIHPAAVPLTTLDDEELLAIAPADFKDIIRNLSSNMSSLGLSSSNWVGDNGSYGNASVNVRNLGNGATLVLLNGKRVIPSQFNQNGGSYVDVQTLVPNIAIDRIDLLKDGNSAIYGSDAVAGVVNVITRDDFRGFESRLFLSQDHESGEQIDATIELLYGMGNADTQFTFSASLLDRGELTYTDRFDRFGRSGLSSFGQPGRYVPLVGESGPQAVESNYWWPNGGPDSTQFQGSLPDPECELVAESDAGMGTLGIHPDFSHICVYDYSTFFSMVRAESQYQLHSSFEHNLESGARLYASLALFSASSQGGNSYYPDVRYVIVPSHNPGLRLDAARRGFEPVPYQALQRVVGGTSASDFESRPLNTRDKYLRSGFDFLVGLKSHWTVLERSWDIDLSLTGANRKITTHLPTDSITERVNLAFEGLGGPECNATTGSPGSGNFGSGNCYYYNSFQTSVFDPATGQLWAHSGSPWAPDPQLSVSEAAQRYQNPPELLQWMHGTYRSDRNLSHLVLDFLAFSDITTFRGLPVGLAIGSQVRRSSAETDYDDISNVFGFAFLSGDTDWTNDTQSWSLFSELHVPLSRRTNLYAALRREQIQDPDAVSLDPKLSLLVSLHEDVSLRASAGTSFKIGSLLQTGGSRTIFQNSSDPFSNAASLAYRASQAKGNPNLAPETAETVSVGLTWNPQAIDGLEATLDWYHYDYNELVIREGHQALIDLDNALRCPNGVNGNQDVGPLCGVWDHDADGVETVFSIGEGLPDKVIRREDGYLVRTEPSYLNANRLVTSGLDASASYSFSIADLGEFVLSSSLTRFLDYKLTLESGLVIDGIGRRNASNAIGRPMPKLRMQTALDWSRANVAGRFSVSTVGSYRDDSAQTAFLGAYLGYARNIESMTTVDAQFRWCTKTWFRFNMPLQLSLGAKNMLNREPPLVIVDGAYDYYLHDPRGRIYYVSMQVSRSNQSSTCR